MSEVKEDAATKIAEAKLAAKQALEAARSEKARLVAEAKAEKARLLAEKKLERETAKIEKERLKAEREATKMPEQNGIRRPRENTLCGKAWAIFDAISAAKSTPAAISDCWEEVAKQGLNEGNVRAEYPRWRKFYGITGIVVSEAMANKKAEKEALKAAKKAEREALKAAKAEAKLAELAAKAQAKLDAKTTV